MAVDFSWELTILEAVHDFYRALLCDFLFEEITPPRGLESESLSAPGRNAEQLLPAMRRWLKLLDLAITPEMLRHGLNSAGDQELAEALLRYYARKQSKSDFDRDKTDLVVSYFYRHPRVPGEWEKTGLALDGSSPPPAFEIALMEILDDAELPELNPVESRLVDEFQFLGEECEHLDHFDQLVESGLIQKARKIKHSFGAAFYHPHVLAAIGPYNHKLGRRFNELYDSAIAQIRAYAAEFQARGGSLAARLDGDITMDQLVRLESRAIHEAEYVRAQERLHYVARLKKAVDAKTRSLAPPGGAEAAKSASRAKPDPFQTILAAAATNAQEPRIRAVEESLRNWVRAAGERCRLIVPMKFGNFTLLEAEAEACCAAYSNEASFRGNNARVLVRMVAITARMQTEQLELRERQNSQHLWRPHAEALAQLQQSASLVMHEAQVTQELATQRGLTEKARNLAATIDRLRKRVEEVARTLSQLQQDKEAVTYGTAVPQQ